MSVNPVVIKSKDVIAKKFTEENVIKLRERFPQLDDDTLARYLIARNNDLEKAAEQLNKFVAWKSTSWPVLKETCIDEFKKGKLYCHGTDKEGRALLIWRSKLSFPKDRDIEQTAKTAIWWMEYAINQLPDDKSKFTVLIDRTNSGSENSDTELVKVLSQQFQDLFPERLHQAVIYPSDFLFYTIWNLVKWFLDPVTREKVKPSLYVSGVKDLIPDEYIPVDMGGSCTYEFNETDFPDFYPPEAIAAIREKNPENHVHMKADTAENTHKEADLPPPPFGQTTTDA